MRTNQLPHYDDSDNPTGCCPKFNPEGWDGQKLHFEDKPFVRAETTSAMHIPLNMGKVFARIQGKMRDADAYDADAFIVLSRDLSPWKAEHLFSVSRPLPGEEALTLTGDFVTRVFEGPYRNAGTWSDEMQSAAGKTNPPGDDVYFFYTTCPKCAKAYGKNHVVGIARTE